jgi:DNA-binding NtrC family response regulator
MEFKIMRFLVVDDNSDTARMIAMLLQRHFEAIVDVAKTGVEARAALEVHSYDCVTLDYQLPDCTGLDMLDEITARADHPPVVMITGHGDEKLASLAFRMGASGYAAKDRKLSVVLPDAVEWALDDATLKREATGEVDQRLEGLIEATHSASRDLRLELDAIASARQKLDKAVKSQDSEAIARAARAVSAIEKNVARSYSLIEKLDSLVSPQAGLEEVPPDGR